MSRRNFWRLAATILLAVCLALPTAWLYTRVEMAREIAYFRQFEVENKDDPRREYFDFTSVHVQTSWFVPREMLVPWMPDALETRLLPLFEEPVSLLTPHPYPQHPQIPLDASAAAAPDPRRIYRLTNLEYLAIGDVPHLPDPGPAKFRPELDLPKLKSLMRLKSLSITGIPIEPESAQSIGSLKLLESLSLNRTILSDANLAPIGNLTQLQHLEISSNPFTDQGVASLAGLVKLRLLNLADTKVTRGCIPHLKGMTQLKWLSMPPIELIDDDLAILSSMRLTHLGITSPHVTDAGLAHLAKMSQLESIDIKHTNVTAEGLKSLQLLSRLKSIALPETSGIGQGLKYLRGCPLIRLEIPNRAITDAVLPDLVWFTPRLNDKQLDLADSQVTDAGMAALAKLKSCGTVSLANTQVTDAGLKPLTQIPGLRSLNLSGTRVTSAGLQTLSQIKALEELKLGETQVDDTHLDELTKLPGLINLDLRATRVTDAGFEHLLQCKNLFRLNLSGTAITDNGLHKLTAMPALERVYVDNTAVTPAALKDFYARKAADKQATGPHK